MTDPADKLPPHMNPMDADEVQELLKSTMHGILPHDTMQRMFATLAANAEEIRKQRNKVAELEARLPFPW